MKGKRKHKYHLVKNENTGFNGIYENMKKKRAVDIGDYIFISERCDLSKKDITFLKSKLLNISDDRTDDHTGEQYFSWYSDFVARVGRIPLVKDYFEFKDIISTY